VADVYWYFKQWEQAKVTEVMLAALRSRPGCSRAAIPAQRRDHRLAKR